MEENRTMTPAERAALADAREADAQRRKYMNTQPRQGSARPAAQSAQPQNTQRSAANTQQRVPTQRTAPQSGQRTNGNVPRMANTHEYPKTAPYVKQANGTKRPVRQGNARPSTAPMQNGEERVDTGEFPSYVRAGKGGYKPPKTKKRVVARQHRRKLDPKFKAALSAVAVVIGIIIIMLIVGVRYSTYELSNGKGEIRFFGLVKDGVPTSGWVSSSDGSNGKLKENTIKYSDGSLYEGGIVNVMRSGEGKLTYANGDVYEGYFSENELNGEGSVLYANGDTYEGQFKDGKKNGYGILKYKTDGGYDVYEGNFVDDKRSGKGTMTYASGDVYEGEFANDLKHGEGTYTHANGRTFVGTYKNNLRYEGTFTFENGAVFVGTFETSSSNQMLEGTYTYANGTTVTGKYDKASKSFIAY